MSVIGHAMPVQLKLGLDDVERAITIIIGKLYNEDPVVVKFHVILLWYVNYLIMMAHDEIYTQILTSFLNVCIKTHERDTLLSN